jgi:hypothetical protein
MRIGDHFMYIRQQNFPYPIGPFLYTVSLMHCMPVGLMDGGSGLVMT